MAKIKKFRPFRVHGRTSSVHKSFFREGYAGIEERNINGRGHKTFRPSLSAFARNQVGNCCGLVCIYGVGGDAKQFEHSLKLAIKQSGEGVGCGALMVALPRPQVERYHLLLIEKGFRVIYGVHNSNYPHDENLDDDSNEYNKHDILVYILEPKRSYDQRRDYTDVQFEEV